MRTINPPTLAAFLVQLTTLTLTLPTQPLPTLLLPRTQYCANSPSTVAGTLLPPRSLLHPPRSPPHLLPPRAPPSNPIPISESNTQIFCGAGTRTYIVVRFVHAIPGPAIISLLEAAYDAILDIIDNLGDGVIRQGYYAYPGPADFASSASSAASVASAASAAVDGGLQLFTQNVNNHQQTWGVLRGAVAALMMFMESEEWNRGAPGSAQFSVYDGVNEVARGAVGPR